MSGDGTHMTEWTDFTWDGPDLAEQTAHSPHLPGPYSLTWDRQGYHPIAQSERLAPPDSQQDDIDRRLFAIITDLVGTPTHLLNPEGTTVWEARTTLWGNTTDSRRGTTSTPLRFRGSTTTPNSARIHGPDGAATTITIRRTAPGSSPNTPPIPGHRIRISTQAGHPKENREM